MDVCWGHKTEDLSKRRSTTMSLPEACSEVEDRFKEMFDMVCDGVISVESIQELAEAIDNLSYMIKGEGYERSREESEEA